jgi:CubicO group peptidase (beta-lactamase class C family)
MPLMRKICLVTGIFILFTAAAAAREPAVFPGAEWAVDTPEHHGLDRAALNRAADRIRWTLIRYCFLVIKEGYLVYERYYFGDKNTRHRAFSLTKSLGSALVGVAVTRNLIRLDDPVSAYLEPPDNMHPNATIRHVLSQVSENRPLGSSFNYNSKDVVNTLGRIISLSARKSGLAVDSEAFARRYLLAPAGMDAGITWEGEDLTIGYGACGTCRAFARLGWLFLNDGRWNDAQIVDRSFMAEAIQPQYPDANTGYGYLIWLNNDQGHWERPFSQGTGKMIGNAPATLVMATGFLGQLVYILPESNTIVVSMGCTPRLETLKTARKLWDCFGDSVVGSDEP